MHAPAPLESARARRWVLGGLWLTVLCVLLAFRGTVLPFAGAALLAYLVAPLVERITRLRLLGRTVQRWVAILSVYAVFALGCYGAAAALVPQLYGELSRVSREASAALTPGLVARAVVDADAWLQARGLPVELSRRALEASGQASTTASDQELARGLEQLVEDSAEHAARLLANNLGQVVAFGNRVLGALVAGLFMVFFLLMVAAFMSIDQAAIRAYVESLVPLEYAEDVRYLARRVDASLSGVVRGQLTICLVNGLLTLAGLLLFGVKFAFLLGTLAAVFSLIPIFGSILSSIPIVAIALADGWRPALGILAWIIGIHALEAYFLNPKIMGSAARIHPVVVTFVLIAGERAFGLVGALFAVPVAAIFVAVFDYARLKAQPPGVAR
ncbi:MAG: AI-2E family transporter [Deltaproteobacteria bacterium]|nr:AI-2E family transporter [Deltaproteobacteria bacterium]